jgi:hypothetical protein
LVSISCHVDVGCVIRKAQANLWGLGLPDLGEFQHMIGVGATAARLKRTRRTPPSLQVTRAASKLAVNKVSVLFD